MQFYLAVATRNSSISRRLKWEQNSLSLSHTLGFQDPSAYSTFYLLVFHSEQNRYIFHFTIEFIARQNYYQRVGCVFYTFSEEYEKRAKSF